MYAKNSSFIFVTFKPLTLLIAMRNMQIQNHEHATHNPIKIWIFVSIFFLNFHKDKVGWAKGCSQTTKSSHTTWDSQYCLCQLERLLTHSVARLLFFKTKRLLTHSADGLCLFPLLTKARHTLFQWYWNFKWTTLQIISLTNLFSLVFALSQVAFNFSWILSWSLISSLVNLLAKFVRNLTQTETKNSN